MTRFKYTADHLLFLEIGYQLMNVEDLTSAFNFQFKVKKTEIAIKAALNNHSITCGRAHGDRFINHRTLFSQEQVDFAKEYYTSHSRVGLTSLLNKKFKTDFTVNQIISMVKRNKIRSGRTGHYEKGNVPWLTGTKGIAKPNSGSFKKGSVPGNIRPMGSERICEKDGFILVKVKEKNPYTGADTRYKHKHIHNWEKAYGPVPEGMVVVFKDADRLNPEPENLILLSRAELLRINKRGYKTAPGELRSCILALAKLEVKTFSLTQKKGQAACL